MTDNPSPLELIIGHSHSHWDHTAGDAEMRNFSMPDVTTKFIAPDVASVIDGYSIPSWPNETAVLDLGGSRLLDIIPLPGHTPDAIAVYDRQTGLLLTGDSVYPGRIFIPQSKIRTFKESHSRLRRFLRENDWEVSWVLGCHIEQKSTPFEEYPLGTKYQPHEHVLQFNVSILEDVEDGLKRIDDDMKPGQVMFAEFSLVVPEAEDEGVSKWALGRQNPLVIAESF
jgi:hydroxyacylglutathione hydrolase